MYKWADYCISKLTMLSGTINSAIVHVDQGSSLSVGQTQNEAWISNQTRIGYTFCTVGRDVNGFWTKGYPIMTSFDRFYHLGVMPMNIVRRKTFISYYHRDDQYYKIAFENLFGDLFINKSVGLGDIDSENSAVYISRLINEGYMNDTSVLVVLIGPKTKCRKHVDWEIYGALDHRVGNCYAGLIGLRLPSHPDYNTGVYYTDQYPARLAANVASGYAILRDWTNDRATMQSYIELANSHRGKYNSLIKNHSVIQMFRNTCE